MRPSLATRGQRGAGSPTRGTSREIVGPAAATAASDPERVTRRTEGVTSATETTVRTSTGRRPSVRPSEVGPMVTRVQPKRADPADSGGEGWAGAAEGGGSG